MRVLALLIGGFVGNLQAADSLQDQLRELAAEHDFTIEGLGRLGDAPAGHAERTPQATLRHLLQGYNYVVIQSRPNVIDKVRIISTRGANPKEAAAKGSFVQTRKNGAHHQVDAALVGPNSVTRTLPLMIDTGATTLVLPDSMMSELGFTPSDLQDATSQTASGTISVKIGKLRSVKIGAASAENVEVSFIPDQQLRGHQLLGMSFLQRFKMTIDDANNELALLPK